MKTHGIRTATLSGACALAIVAMLAAGPALACRGTAEYPQVSAELAQANMPAAEKSALAERLKAGDALHQLGHELDNRDIRNDSLAILDAIKAKLTDG